MKTLEWITFDKSLWGSGPWQSEPDKRQWLDEETGLPCMIKRGPVGALCGYVGVLSNHPAHRRSYDDLDLDVHGGLTFANSCEEISEESFRSLKEKWTPVLNSYESFVEKAQSELICHVRENTDPDNIWWLGFDCAHYQDYSPCLGRHNGIYRDFNYVTDQCQNLARQLKSMESV